MLEKTKEAQIQGEYKSTAIDTEKASVDFRLVNMDYIIWKDGKGQLVTKAQLRKLQKTHTWKTDF